jgi:hypothetical protein
VPHTCPPAARSWPVTGHQTRTLSGRTEGQSAGLQAPLQQAARTVASTASAFKGRKLSHCATRPAPPSGPKASAWCCRILPKAATALSVARSLSSPLLHQAHRCHGSRTAQQQHAYVSAQLTGDRTAVFVEQAAGNSPGVRALQCTGNHFRAGYGVGAEGSGWRSCGHDAQSVHRALAEVRVVGPGVLQQHRAGLRVKRRASVVSRRALSTLAPLPAGPPSHPNTHHVEELHQPCGRVLHQVVQQAHGDAPLLVRAATLLHKTRHTGSLLRWLIVTCGWWAP